MPYQQPTRQAIFVLSSAPSTPTDRALATPEAQTSRLASRLASAPAFFALFGGIAVLLPYLLLPVIPGIDYANHLARLHVLGAAAGSPILQTYAPHWALMPDLGLDLIYMALKPIASPETVLRVALVGSLVAMLGAVWFIQRRFFGRASYAMALAPLLTPGLPVVMGYINFTISCAFVMTGIALALAWRLRLTALRVAILATIGAGAWLCHIAGFATFVAFLGSAHLVWRLAQFPRGLGVLKAAATVAAIALPGFVLSLLSEHSGTPSNPHFGLPKLRALVAPVLATGTRGDYILWAGIALLFAGILIGGRWFVARPARAGLVALAVAIVLLPWRFATAFDVDSRLTAPAMLVLLGASCITPGRRAWTGPALLAGLTLLIAKRDADLLALGAAQAREVGAFRAIDRILPQGSALMVATDQWRQADCSRAPEPFSLLPIDSHLAAYATIDRAVWEPTIFAGAGMQPIRSVKPDFPAAPQAGAPPSLDTLAAVTASGAPSPAGWPGWPARYAYLLVLGHGCGENPLPAVLSPAAAGPGFTLFSVHAPPA